MQIVSNRFSDNGANPTSRAFCSPDEQSLVTLPYGRNRCLSGALPPAGRTALLVLWHDADVPSKPEVVARRGRRIAAPLRSGIREGAARATTQRPTRDVAA